MYSLRGMDAWMRDLNEINSIRRTSHILKILCDRTQQYEFNQGRIMRMLVMRYAAAMAHHYMDTHLIEWYT